MDDASSGLDEKLYGAERGVAQGPGGYGAGGQGCETDVEGLFRSAI